MTLFAFRSRLWNNINKILLSFNGVYIDRTARVLTRKVGSGTRIWAHTNIMNDVEIGKDCNICDGCFIERGVRIGDRVTIKTNVSLWKGLIVHDDVFIGPNVSFCNDKHPRSRNYVDAEITELEKGCSIGAGAVILPSLVIGNNATVGAGSVVTRTVRMGSTVAGNPAKELRSRDCS